jgi:hypothetical protein
LISDVTSSQRLGIHLSHSDQGCSIVGGVSGDYSGHRSSLTTIRLYSIFTTLSVSGSIVTTTSSSPGYSYTTRSNS